MAVPERPWLQLAVPDAPDPLDPGGDSLTDVNGDAEDETDDDDRPFYVQTAADHDRWTMCEEVAEKMTNGDVELGPLVTRSLYFSQIPTDEQDVNRVAANTNKPPSSEVPVGIED